MYLLLLLLVSLAVSAIGWKYFIYFFSLGYGFGIVALSLTCALIFGSSLTLPTILLCIILFAYGCRLGGYLYKREKKSAEYRKILYGDTNADKKPLMEIFMVWFFCAILYVAEVSPIAFRLSNTAAGMAVTDLWAYIGAIVMATGAILEAVADAQKSAAKKVNPKRFVNTGVYRLVRCPNYLGEILVWTGCFLSGIGAQMCWWQWLIAVIGYAGILFVMFSGARRLEIRQNAQYGADEEYQQYVKNTPILLPFVPLYSVEKYTFLKA